MSIYAALTGLTSLTFFLTGFFVYTRNTSSFLYKRCFIFSSAVALWALGYFITLIEFPNYTFNIAASRFSHAFGSLIPTTYLHFVWAILRKEKRSVFFKASYLFSGFMFLTSLTPLVVKVLLPKMGIQYYPEWGALYPIYSALFLIFPGYAQYEMAKRILFSRGTERTRLIYFFVALGLAFAGGVSLFLLIFNIPFAPHLSVLIILYPPMMGYTILVHRFLEIDVIIRKTLVFGALLAAVLGFASTITFLLSKFLSSSASNLIVLQFVTVVPVVFLVEPLRAILVRVTDRYLFQKQFDYTKILKEASKDIALVTSLKDLSRKMLIVLIRKARTKNAAILVRTSADDFELRGCLGYGRLAGPNIELDVHSPLIAYLGKKQVPVTKETIKNELEHANDKTRLNFLTEVLTSMEVMKAEVVVPSFLSASRGMKGKGPFLTLRGVLALGEKKSDDEYHEKDLDVLSTIAQEHAIAFENARLYDEVLERSNELTEINVEMQGVQEELLGSLRQTEFANKELANTNEKLRVTQASLIVAEKNATMVGMAKAIGHEVNNPLTTLAGRAQWIYRDQLKVCRDTTEKYADLISEDDFDKITKAYSRIDENAQRIGHSAKRIEYVVKTLTDILKDTKGKMGPLSLIVMCREAMEATRFQTYDENLGGCKIDLEITANVMIIGNLEQLLQVFVNLIKNAYEAMGDQPERRIVIEGTLDPDNGKMAKIRIADNGPGISPDVLSKIWTQGFSTKKKAGNSIGDVGQGQGLFICKHMIESIHGGQIYVESNVGSGTAFVIKLPLADMEHI